MTYTSPHGKPRGLARRLAAMAGRLGNGADRHLWAGLGIIEDLRMASHILNKREWLEHLRTSPDPDAQRFADELLADDETLEAVQDAASSTRTPIAANTADSAYRQPTYDPVATVEQLDDAAQGALHAYRQVRQVLEQAGVADENTPDADLPALIGVLLS